MFLTNFLTTLYIQNNLCIRYYPVLRIQQLFGPEEFLQMLNICQVEEQFDTKLYHQFCFS